MSNKQTL